jgi:hypothetical protein
VHVLADSRQRRFRAAPSSELALLGGALALAAGGIGIVSAALARQRRASGDERAPIGENRLSTPDASGRPELPDEPLGVPAEEAAGNGEVELPGFPRIDPTHG